MENQLSDKKRLDDIRQRWANYDSFFNGTLNDAKEDIDYLLSLLEQPTTTAASAATKPAIEAARIASKDRHEQSATFEDNLRWLDEKVAAGWPSEEEAEAILREHGTSGKEITNAFIDRLLRDRQQFKDEGEHLRAENHDLKTIIEATTGDDPSTALSKLHKIQYDARADAIREASELMKEGPDGLGGDWSVEEAVAELGKLESR